jgi:hypothetical protein
MMPPREQSGLVNIGSVVVNAQCFGRNLVTANLCVNAVVS